MPVNGKFTQRQLEIYSIVEACHDYVLEVAKPGVKYMDVHFAVCKMMTERLKELGLMKGDTDEAVAAGAHAMFLPHGLGHMMGMDVHDMEGLGQIYVGFDEETRPNLEQFGTNCLRMGRKLEEGFVMTDEPGIYFIPHLIDDWKASGHCKEFLNFDKLETYKDFGGIRIEDDILITKEGCRFLGSKRIPYHPQELEHECCGSQEEGARKEPEQACIHHDQGQSHHNYQGPEPFGNLLGLLHPLVLRGRDLEGNRQEIHPL